jgi:serpin B
MLARVLPVASMLWACGLLGAEDRITPGMNQFALDAYSKLAKGSGNVVFSPLNVYTGLSMTLEGARGQTAREIAGVLHQPQADGAAIAALMAELSKTAAAGGTELSNANSLWLNGSFRIQDAFRQILQTQYGAPPASLDFSRDPEGARRQINNWTAEHTKGKIPELFGAGSLDSSTRLVMASAIYFNGKWQSAFRVTETRPAPFRLTGGRTVESSFMNHSAQFGYAETDALQILEMKYGDGALAFDVLLPKSADGLADLEKSLTPDKLAGWFRTLHGRTVEVALPKFRAESAFSLRDALSQMGMPSAFTNAADFSGIDDRRDLYASRVVHKAYVDVTEQGTEAAAATGTAVRLIASIVEPERAIFRADHPFLFLIRDSRSGAILFAGRLENPKA